MSALREFIKRHEGLKLVPYVDTVGKWTWGYGRNIDDVPCKPEELLALLQKGATQEVAELFLNNDIRQSDEDCLSIFQEFEYLSENRRIALTSVMFNLGLRKFKGFRKMIAAVRSYRWKDAHDELLDSRRARQIPMRSREEAEMLKNG